MRVEPGRRNKRVYKNVRGNLKECVAHERRSRVLMNGENECKES